MLVENIRMTIDGCRYWFDAHVDWDSVCDHCHAVLKVMLDDAEDDRPVDVIERWLIDKYQQTICDRITEMVRDGHE